MELWKVETRDVWAKLRLERTPEQSLSLADLVDRYVVGPKAEGLHYIVFPLKKQREMVKAVRLVFERKDQPLGVVPILNRELLNSPGSENVLARFVWIAEASPVAIAACRFPGSEPFPLRLALGVGVQGDSNREWHECTDPAWLG